MANKIKGGGTRKVCLPASKVRSMSKEERQKVVNAKKNAASRGKYRRSSKSNVKGARKKGATLKDWFDKENWITLLTLFFINISVHASILFFVVITSSNKITILFSIKSIYL